MDPASTRASSIRTKQFSIRCLVPKHRLVKYTAAHNSCRRSIRRKRQAVPLTKPQQSNPPSSKGKNGLHRLPDPSVTLHAMSPLTYVPSHQSFDPSPSSCRQPQLVSDRSLVNGVGPLTSSCSRALAAAHVISSELMPLDSIRENVTMTTKDTNSGSRKDSELLEQLPCELALSLDSLSSNSSTLDIEKHYEEPPVAESLPVTVNDLVPFIDLTDESDSHSNSYLSPLCVESPFSCESPYSTPLFCRSPTFSLSPLRSSSPPPSPPLSYLSPFSISVPLSDSSFYSHFSEHVHQNCDPSLSEQNHRSTRRCLSLDAEQASHCKQENKSNNLPSVDITHPVHSLQTNSCPSYTLDSVITKFNKSDLYYQLLLSWQKSLNQRRGIEGPIFVENLHDTELPPDNFTYITTSIPKEGVPLPHPTALVGCSCNDCNESSFCCPQMAGQKPAYYKNGRVKVPKGNPIYECNFMCSCDATCQNRVVQHGRQFPVCIFRTPDGRGWGVKTCVALKKGSFVTEYLGEIITSEEAERRGKKYDQEGCTYLFDLDFVEDHSVFTIDAGHFGNISHFFNHSCNPNLQVYSVWISTLDPRLPNLALFAKRDIAEGEELTFDYQMNSSNMAHKGKVPCLCGAKNCTGFLC